jgi:hypothetical protein
MRLVGGRLIAFLGLVFCRKIHCVVAPLGSLELVQNLTFSDEKTAVTDRFGLFNFEPTSGIPDRNT